MPKTLPKELAARAKKLPRLDDGDPAFVIRQLLWSTCLVCDNPYMEKLLREGVSFIGRLAPEDYPAAVADYCKRWPKAGRLRQCYQHAQRLVGLERAPGLRYFEGYAVNAGLIPVPHAWLAAEDGKVIDVVWDAIDRDGPTLGESLYFGAEIPQKDLTRLLGRYGFYGDHLFHYYDSLEVPDGNG